jgi:hypothetical protein
LKRGEIDLFHKIISDYEQLLQRFIGVKTVRSFNAVHEYDPEVAGMRDLALLPVVYWPTFQAYAEFKQYWSYSNKVLEVYRNNPIDEVKLKEYAARHDASLSNLKSALMAARKGT